MALSTLLTVASALTWGALLLVLLRTVRAVPVIQQLRTPPPARWPRLSLVMPARNEEATLEGALRTKLSASYPALELVLVDDRSTDATGGLADALAREEPRLKVVHVESLPEGWLGKVHAMQRGLEHATGEWVLFSDADVHLAPDTLECVVAHAEAEGLDHVTVLPTVTCRGFWLQATLGSFFLLLCAAARLCAVGNPRSSAAMGAGAFNLVRRSALARTPGLAWLKMEIADDVALGVMLKRAGGRQAVLNGRGRVSLAFYPSLTVLARALEKNGASGPLPAFLVLGVLLVVLTWGLLAGLLSGDASLVLLGAATWAVGSAATFGLCRWLGFARLPALVPFAGALPLAWACMRSGVLAAVRGGVQWRGTFYPTAVVHAGRRIG